MIQASLPLSLRPLVTSWRGWISISFTLRIVSGFVLLIYSCLPLHPLCLCPCSPSPLPSFPLLPYLTAWLPPSLCVCLLYPEDGLKLTPLKDLLQSPTCPFILQQLCGSSGFHNQGHYSSVHDYWKPLRSG